MTFPSSGCRYALAGKRVNNPCPFLSTECDWRHWQVRFGTEIPPGGFGYHPEHLGGQVAWQPREQIELTIHSNGGKHTHLVVPRNRTGQRLWNTFVLVAPVPIPSLPPDRSACRS